MRLRLKAVIDRMFVVESLTADSVENVLFLRTTLC